MEWLNIQFKDPWWLLLLLLVPIMWFWQRWGAKKERPIKIPTTAAFSSQTSMYNYVLPILNYLRYLSISLAIISLARPQQVKAFNNIDPEKGIDIVLAVDLSLSMLAEDLQPNRLEALKQVAQKFVLERPADRIALVVYAGEAVTRIPLTSDKDLLATTINDLEVNDQAKDFYQMKDGTAIGVGLATAVNHIKNSKAKSKVIILITDGKETVAYNNGLIQLDAGKAAKIAKDKNIKVYTVGVGTNNDYIPAPFRLYGADLTFDPVLLQAIAQETGGAYFQATDNQKLQEIYNQINKLEKSEINIHKLYDYKEEYFMFLLPALFIFLIDAFCRLFIFKELV